MPAQGADGAATAPPVPQAVGGALSPGVAAAMGRSESRSIFARSSALRGLGPELGTVDVAALRGLLAERFAEQSEYNRLGFNAIKNDAVNALLRQKALPAGFGGELAAMALDERHDALWRDYCVQYLALYWRRRWPPPEASAAHDAHRSERAAILDAYARSVSERDKPVAGTALLGIYSLSRDYRDFNPQRVGALALHVAEDPAACEPARVSALQVCAQAGIADALPLARRLALANRQGQLRLSAVAALGFLGEAQDEAPLAALAGGGDGRIRTAAGAALRRLETRIGH